MKWDTAAEPSSWTWNTAEKRRERDAQIMEWWAIGLSRDWIAKRIGITPQRVSQIVKNFK